MDEEEDIDFHLPKFDEEKFVRKEKEKIKVTFIAFIFGIFVSIISFGFWALLHGNNLRWILILLFALFTISWLKYLFIRLNINLEDIDKKGMLGVYSTYFFTWLILLVVLVNPPFYDDTPPLVEVVTLPSMQEPGGTVEIVARITDNAGIQNISLVINGNGTTMKIPPSQYIFNNSIFQYTFYGPTSINGEIEYNYSLIAKDINGHIVVKNGSFWYSNDALKITSSKLTDLLSGDTISIKADSRIAPWNFRVYYQLDNGSEINVNRNTPDDKERYITTPEYEGWEPLKNYTLTLHAEVRYYFENLPIEFSNIVTDTTIYHVSTGDDNDIGKEPPLVEYNYTRASIGKKQLPNTLNYKLPHPTRVMVPGFDIVLLVSAIVITGFIFKYRKKDRHYR
ncbi:MAG: hypothetical protein DRN12_02050 [Thermoplasmata archaeon]|nr:MAG: hypothetical protein DRN12_02050 [Thermoplasmata archaeon]